MSATYRTPRVGIIGAGGIAQIHLSTMRQHGTLDPVAVADTNAQAAESTARRFEIPVAVGDYRALVDRDDIDGVLVCTPSALHAGPAIDALEHGKHVLVEKPMDASLASATEMVRAAHRVGRILMCALKLRFSTQLRVGSFLIDSGALGELYYADASVAYRRSTPAIPSFIRRSTAGLGASGDFGIYVLDAFMCLMGFPRPLSVSATTSNAVSRGSSVVFGGPGPVAQQIEVEDFAAAWIRFEGGLSMLLKSAWSVHLDHVGGPYLLGDRGGLRIGFGLSDDDPVRLFTDARGAMTDTVFTELPTWRAENLDLFRREQDAWAHAIRDGGPSPIDADQVLMNNVILDGIVRSSVCGGREVLLDLPVTR